MADVRHIRALCAAALGLLLLVAALPAAHAAGAGAGAGERQSTVLRGGDALYGSGGVRCTLGFNATDGTGVHGILPGHCGNVADSWYADPERSVPVGRTSGATFPGSDHAAIRYTGPDLEAPSEVTTYGDGPRRVERAVEPRPGMPVCRSGPASGRQCGTVTQVNVSLPGGLVDGLFTVDLCAEPGDDGGPVVSGDAAVGFLVHTPGDCGSTGTTYYQPVQEPLAAYGLEVGYGGTG
ncbi:S1 family peptidase [Streptomyces boncukensis]|nr:S1 family peptidase [Streptomyces boncukensis]